MRRRGLRDPREQGGRAVAETLQEQGEREAGVAVCEKKRRGTEEDVGKKKLTD